MNPQLHLSTLLPVSLRHVGDQDVNAVDGRTLHAFLEVGTAFKDWIARSIEDFGFIEGHDFCSFLGESQGGRPAKEYTISIPMAKELAMVQRTPKGKEARLYFIECERRAQTLALNPANLSRLQLLTMAMAAEQERMVLADKVEVLEPKAEALDRISTADGSMCITNAAKDLQVPPKRLFIWLQAHEWIYRRVGGKNWVAYQDKIQSGRLEHKITTVERGDGSEKVVEQVLITPKGLAWLALHGVAV